MTVQELRQKLFNIENQNLPVVVWKDKRGFPDIIDIKIEQTTELDGTHQTVVVLVEGK